MGEVVDIAVVRGERSKPPHEQVETRMKNLIAAYTGGATPRTFTEFDDSTFEEAEASVPVANDMLVRSITFTKRIKARETEYSIALMGHNMLPTANMADGLVTLYYRARTEGPFNEQFDTEIVDVHGESYSGLASVDALLQTVESGREAGKF